MSDVPSYWGDSEAMAINSGRECVGRGTGAFETHYPSIGAIGRAIGTGDDDGKPETFLGFFSFANRIGGRVMMWLNWGVGSLCRQTVEFQKQEAACVRQWEDVLLVTRPTARSNESERGGG